MQAYKKALVILPFVALVKEKAEHLKEVLGAMECSVKGYFGNDNMETSTPLTERWTPAAALVTFSVSDLHDCPSISPGSQIDCKPDDSGINCLAQALLDDGQILCYGR